MNYSLPQHLIKQISPEQAFHYRIVPKTIENEKLLFLTDMDITEDFLSELEIVLNLNLTLEPAEADVVQNYLTANYRKGKPTQGNELRFTSDFLDHILLTAKELDSSDIHFEPYEQLCRVRFRMDGKLVEQFQVPLEDYPAIINKIKIRANLDIAEKRLPQDGRITVKSEEDFDIWTDVD